MGQRLPAMWKVTVKAAALLSQDYWVRASLGLRAMMAISKSWLERPTAKLMRKWNWEQSIFTGRLPKVLFIALVTTEMSIFMGQQLPAI